MSTTRGVEYQRLNSEEGGAEGNAANGMLLIDDEQLPTADLQLSLTYYSRLIYFIIKQERLASLRREMSAADAKQTYKAEKQRYKDNATQKANENYGISQTIAVFRGQRGFVDELKEKGGVEKVVMGSGATFMDFVITFFRSFGQVFLDIVQRGDNVSNGGEDNPNSIYTNSMFKNGDPQSGLSPVGTASVSLALIAPAIGIARGKYQSHRKRKLKGLTYFGKKLNKVSDGDEVDELDELVIENQLAQRLQRAMKDKTLSTYTVLPAQSLASDRKTILDRMIDAVESFYETDSFATQLAKIERVKAKLANGEIEQQDAQNKLTGLYAEIRQARKSKPVRVAASIFRGVVTTVSFLWDRLSTYSYVFWLAWMPFVMVAGLAAASGPMMPFILLITLVVGTAFSVLKLVDLNSTTLFSAAKTEPSLTDVDDATKAEFDRLAHETKVLEFIDKESAGIAASLGVKKTKARTLYTDDEATSQSALKDRLLGSVHERRGRVFIAGFRNFLGGVLTVVFIGWLASSLLGYLGAGAIANFIGDVPFGGIGGAVAGIFTSITAMSQMRKQQLEYERKVETILKAPYKDTGLTKEQKFQELYAQVEFRKSLIEKFLAREENQAALKRPAHFDELDERSKALYEQHVAKHAAYKAYLAKIDVFNDRYFEKFSHDASAFTVFKKVLNRAYEFVFASQTGAFTARFTLLKGGLFAGALGFSVIAGMWPFLIAAGVLMLLIGGIALIDYQLRANQQHRENFLNTLDARIYYLETKNDELFSIQSEYDIEHPNNVRLTVESEVADAPTLDEQPRQQPTLRDSDYNYPPEEAGDNDLDQADKPETPSVSAGSPDTLYAGSPDTLYAGSLDTFFVSGSKPSIPDQQVAVTYAGSPGTFFVSGNKQPITPGTKNESGLQRPGSPEMSELKDRRISVG